MSLMNTLLTKTSKSAVVIYKEKIAQHSYHIRIRLNDNSFRNYQPGQQIKVLVGLDNISALSDLVRTYSIWNYNEDTDEADLAINDFSDGQGARWIQRLEEGQTIYFSGPKGRFIFEDGADHYIFLGDISALSHLYELSRQLDSSQNGLGLIYGRDTSHFFEDKFTGETFRYITCEPSQATHIIEELGRHDVNKPNSMVYIAGETSFCVEMTYHFRKHYQWPNKAIRTKPFWDRTRKGLD